MWSTITNFANKATTMVSDVASAAREVVQISLYFAELRRGINEKDIEQAMKCFKGMKEMTLPHVSDSGWGHPFVERNEQIVYFLQLLYKGQYKNIIDSLDIYQFFTEDRDFFQLIADRPDLRELYGPTLRSCGFSSSGLAETWNNRVKQLLSYAYYGMSCEAHTLADRLSYAKKSLEYYKSNETQMLYDYASSLDNDDDISSDVMHLLAKALFSSATITNSHSLLEQAFAKEPNNDLIKIYLHTVRSKVYLCKKQYKEAVKESKLALDINSDFLYAKYINAIADVAYLKDKGVNSIGNIAGLVSKGELFSGELAYMACQDVQRKALKQDLNTDTISNDISCGIKKVLESIWIHRLLDENYNEEIDDSVIDSMKSLDCQYDSNLSDDYDPATHFSRMSLFDVKTTTTSDSNSGNYGCHYFDDSSTDADSDHEYLGLRILRGKAKKVYHDKLKSKISMKYLKISKIEEIFDEVVTEFEKMVGFEIGKTYLDLNRNYDDKKIMELFKSDKNSFLSNDFFDSIKFNINITHFFFSDELDKGIKEIIRNKETGLIPITEKKKTVSYGNSALSKIGKAPLEEIVTEVLLARKEAGKSKNIDDCVEEVASTIKDKLDYIILSMWYHAVRVEYRFSTDYDYFNQRFEADNDIDFLAQLNLCNRTAKRLSKTKMDLLQFYPTAEQKKGFFQKEDKDGAHQIKNVMSYKGQKTEFTSRIEKTGTREVGQVTGIGKYTDLILPNSYIQGDYFSGKYGCLLFGVEVMRNPSAIIHHYMMLDLIKAGKLSQKEAFAEAAMPMAMVKAVQGARYIGEKRGYHIDYSGPTSKEVGKILLKKEKILLLKWFAYLIDNGDISEAIVKEGGDAFLNLNAIANMSYLYSNEETTNLMEGLIFGCVKDIGNKMEATIMAHLSDWVSCGERCLDYEC